MVTIVTSVPPVTPNDGQLLDQGRDGDAAQVHASLDRIECESDRLEAMLAQALELSRLETAAADARDHVALDALLEDVILNADYEGALRGRKVVLYAYPKDNTPACTEEAIAFNAST